MSKSVFFERLKPAWADYRVWVLGSGLPFLATLAAFALVEGCGVHPGVWVLMTFFSCQIEAWVFHSEKHHSGSGRVLNFDTRPAGIFWAFYSFIGLAMNGIFVKEPETEVVTFIRVQAGLSCFVLTLAAAGFLSALFSRKDEPQAGRKIQQDDANDAPRQPEVAAPSPRVSKRPVSGPLQILRFAWRAHCSAALGTGLPWAVCLLGYSLLVHWFLIPLWLFVLAWIGACFAEAALSEKIHGKTEFGTPGGLWMFFAFSPLVAARFTDDLLVVAQCYCGLAVFFLFFGAIFFVVGVAKGVSDWREQR